MNHSTNGLSGTPWHTDYVRKDPREDRRHRSRCIYYDHNTHECGSMYTNSYGHKCPGSTHCTKYTTEIVTAPSPVKLKKDNEPYKFADKNYIVTKHGSTTSIKNTPYYRTGGKSIGRRQEPFKFEDGMALDGDIIVLKNLRTNETFSFTMRKMKKNKVRSLYVLCFGQKQGSTINYYGDLLRIEKIIHPT